MLADELLQHVGVGAPAGLGLFPGGQHQLLEEHLAELLGRVDVELVPRLPPDVLLQRFYAAAHALAVGGQGPAVHQEARALHLRQHGAERQLDGVVELQRVRLAELPLQHGIELPEGLGRRRLAAQVARGQARGVIAALRGVEDIGGQGSVSKTKPSMPRPSASSARIRSFTSVADLFHLRGEEARRARARAPRRFRPAGRRKRPARRRAPARRAPRRRGRRHRARRRAGDGLLRRQRAQVRQGLRPRGRGLLRLPARGQAPFFNEAVEAERRKAAHRARAGSPGPSAGASGSTSTGASRRMVASS